LLSKKKAARLSGLLPIPETADQKPLTPYRGMAPIAHVLFNRFLRFNPKNPNWVNRDRFVLS